MLHGAIQKLITARFYGPRCRYRTAEVGKRIYAVRPYHSRQCGGVLKPR